MLIARGGFTVLRIKHTYIPIARYRPEVKSDNRQREETLIEPRADPALSCVCVWGGGATTDDISAIARVYQ